jgi:8-oxo-dGTP diphosphatase
MTVGEFSVAAYAVVRNERGEVLLTRRRDGDEWVLPGGSMERRESPWDAVVRETREETGLEIEIERLVGVYAKRQEADLVFAFSALIRGGRMRASDERDRVRFFSADALPPELSERDRQRLADDDAKERAAFLRVQRSEGDEPPPGTR